MLLDLRNYPAHRLDGKPRVRARRGLGGKHDSIGTVENRIRDVARFGAGWTRVRNHRLEHLRCCDYRLANAICERDYPLSVSYTHLRAHETGRNLVCRLLLEKKKIY